MTISPLAPATPAPARGGSARPTSDGDFGALVEHHLVAARAEDDTSRRRDARAAASCSNPGTAAGADGGAAPSGQATQVTTHARAAISHGALERPGGSATAEDGLGSGQVPASGEGAGRAQAGAPAAVTAPGTTDDREAADGDATADAPSTQTATTAAGMASAAAATAPTPGSPGAATTDQSTAAAATGQLKAASTGQAMAASAEAAATVGVGGAHAPGPAGQAAGGVAGTPGRHVTAGTIETSGPATSAADAGTPGAEDGGTTSAAKQPRAGAASADGSPSDAPSPGATKVAEGSASLVTAGVSTHPGAASTAASSAGDGVPSTQQGNAVTAQVFDHVTRLVSRGDGTHRLMLRLHPADLGEVKVVLTVRNNTVDVTLSAGPAARDALREGSPQLRALLELTGATTGQVVIRDHAAGAVAPTPGTATWTSGQQGDGRGGQPGQQTPAGAGEFLGGDSRQGGGRPDAPAEAASGRAATGGSAAVAGTARRTQTSPAPTPARVGAVRLDLDL